MNQLPLLERTSNDTDRIVIYHIQQGDTDSNKFFLYKTAILPSGAMKPEGIVFYGEDYDFLHSQILKQSFFPMAPLPEDDPRILMTYL